MRKIKIAVIGCGGIYSLHWEGWKEQFDKGYDDFELVAFCDIVPERAQAYADKYEALTGIKASVFSSIDALFASGIEFEVAELQVPHSEHHRLAITLLDAGKHVMIEKPLAITMRAAKQMMNCARKNGVTLKVMENYRYSISERAAAWAVKSGMIGQPRLMTMMDVGLRQWYWDWRDHKYIAGGCWTLDGGIHFADLWMNILGPVKKVQAVSKTYDTTRYKDFDIVKKDEPIYYRKTRSLLPVNPQTFGTPVESDLEDTTSAILEFENGVLGTWLVSRAAPGKVNRDIIISGSEGTLIWGKGISDYSEKTVISWEELKEMYVKRLTDEEKETIFPHGLQSTGALEQREFLDFIEGKRALEVTDEIGYLDMAVPYAVYEAAASGRSVLVKDVMDLKEETYQKEINEKLGI